MGLIKRGTENGVKREMKQRFEGKQMNFLDTAAYKGIQFETKQNLNFR